MQSIPLNMNTEGSIEIAHIEGLSVISGLNLEKM